MSGQGLAPIISGLESMRFVGQYVEVQRVRVVNPGRDTESEQRTHTTGRLIGTYDEFVNDELRETTLVLEGGGGMYRDRLIEIDWREDPDKQLIQTIEVAS